MSEAHSMLRCIDWGQFSLELMTGAIAGSGSSKLQDNKYYGLSRVMNGNGEVIDFFLSHSWHDDGAIKYAALQRFAADFVARYGREPTFWLDKTCIDQRNIRDGLRVLPVNVMSCRQMLVFWGETYAHRLWCVWELFTLLVFMRLDQATERLEFLTGSDEGWPVMLKQLKVFDVKSTHCFDPNEEKQLRRVIRAAGAERFNRRIRALSAALVQRGRRSRGQRRASEVLRRSFTTFTAAFTRSSVKSESALSEIPESSGSDRSLSQTEMPDIDDSAEMPETDLDTVGAMSMDDLAEMYRLVDVVSLDEPTEMYF